MKLVIYLLVGFFLALFLAFFISPWIIFLLFAIIGLVMGLRAESRHYHSEQERLYREQEHDQNEIDKFFNQK